TPPSNRRSLRRVSPVFVLPTYSLNITKSRVQDLFPIRLIVAASIKTIGKTNQRFYAPRV
ncbi:MAG TPA: hypothetical protein VF627_04935, partial [Abditibacterium sp.]